MLEAIEVILFIALFAADAYAFGNLNEVRRALERIDEKRGTEERRGGLGEKRVEHAGAEKIAAAVHDEKLGEHDGQSTWHAGHALESDVSEMRSQQLLHERQLDELAKKIQFLEEIPPQQLAGEGNGRVGEKLDRVSSQLARLSDRFDAVERDVAGHVAGSEVERNEMLEKISAVAEKTETKPKEKNARPADKKLAVRVKKLEDGLLQLAREESALEAGSRVERGALLEKIEKVRTKEEKLEAKVSKKVEAKAAGRAKKKAKKIAKKAGKKTAAAPRTTKTTKTKVKKPAIKKTKAAKKAPSQLRAPRVPKPRAPRAELKRPRAPRPTVRKVIKETTVTTVEAPATPA